jgi:hypothetical protein
MSSSTYVVNERRVPSVRHYCFGQFHDAVMDCDVDGALLGRLRITFRGWSGWFVAYGQRANLMSTVMWSGCGRVRISGYQMWTGYGAHASG